MSPFTLCAYVGPWKKRNIDCTFWRSVRTVSLWVRERERREGGRERKRGQEIWEGERWRQMRKGVRELKWPCGPDADKLPSLSALSARALICHCHPAAFHPFLHLLLLPLYLFLFPPLHCIIFFPTCFSPSSCKDFFTYLCFCSLNTLLIHWMVHSRHVQLMGNDLQLWPLFWQTQTGMGAFHWISGIFLPYWRTTAVARCFVFIWERSRSGTQKCCFFWNMLQVVTCWGSDNYINFQHKTCIDNKLQRWWFSY